MSKSTFLGHPLHPQMIIVPGGLIPFSFAMDLMYRMTGKRSYSDAAYYSLAGGFAGGAAAGVAGAMDYMTIPAGSHEKRIANIHAALNIALLAASAVNLAMRSRGEDARAPLPFALSAMAAAGLLVSSWYGGHLVYKHGMRVEGRSPVEHAPEARLPGDERGEHAFEAAERWAPARGPESSWHDRSLPR